MNIHKPEFQYQREAEITLIVLSENPEMIAGEISALTVMGEYRLLPRSSVIIHDLYFDLSNQALRKQKIALRIREIEKDYLVTLKGPASMTGWCGLERSEIEVPWSQDALDMIIEELKEIEIQVSQRVQNFLNDRPSDVMKSLGFHIVQDRENYRRIRDIARLREENSPVLAEMAIDFVVYHFSSQDIRHHEVEIESKSEEGGEAISKVMTGLIDMYGKILHIWRCGKLTTGTIIEEMLGKGILEGMINPDDNLKPVAYKLIEYYFRRDRR